MAIMALIDIDSTLTTQISAAFIVPPAITHFIDDSLSHDDGLPHDNTFLCVPAVCMPYRLSAHHWAVCLSDRSTRLIEHRR